MIMNLVSDFITSHLIHASASRQYPFHNCCHFASASRMTEQFLFSNNNIIVAHHILPLLDHKRYLCCQIQLQMHH